MFLLTALGLVVLVVVTVAGVYWIANNVEIKTRNKDSEK